MDLDFKKTPIPSPSTIPPDVKFKLIIIGFLLFGVGTVGMLWFRWEIKQAKREEQQPAQPEDLELPKVQATPTSEAPTQPQSIPENEPQPKLQPGGKYSGNQKVIKIPIRPSNKQLNCLRNGGGSGCFEDKYQPNIPHSELPVSPDIPNIKTVAIAVASGRELPYWKPDYNLRPMPSGVCPPSLVIAYQNQLFCGRRPIAEQPQTVRRLW